MELEKINSTSKKELYGLMAKQMEILVEPELPLVTNLSNASALLSESLEFINWAGFYLLKEDTLFLGPFQGKAACTKILLGKGVCGVTAKQAKTQLVADVHEFPGHIACDSASNSEIVIPILVNNQVRGVLDIDSPIKARFDEQDKKGLEEIVRVLESRCDWRESIV